MNNNKDTQRWERLQMDYVQKEDGLIVWQDDPALRQTVEERIKSLEAEGWTLMSHVEGPYPIGTVTVRREVEQPDPSQINFVQL